MLGLHADRTSRSKSKLSFLFESAATTETIGRYSFVGAGLYFKIQTKRNED